MIEFYVDIFKYKFSIFAHKKINSELQVFIKNVINTNLRSLF